MKRITIKDLARLLSISASTVSRALSNHPDISDATKKRVKNLARELNYSTNMQARIFRRQNSGLIALVLPEINMFFTPKLIEGINQSIMESNYTLITFISNDNKMTEEEIVDNCLAWAVEGVLISLSRNTNSLEHLSAFKEANIKCLLLDKTLDTDFPTIRIDGAKASYIATVHLLDNNHKNILGIFGDPNLRITKDRIQGFQKAHAERGIDLDDNNILTVEKSGELDFILPELLEDNEQLSAIFTMSDELLAKTHYHILASGKSIPDHMSIISISNGFFPNLTYPPTTHVQVSGYRMGKRGCDYLINAIEENLDMFNMELPTKLIEMSSVTTRD